MKYEYKFILDDGKSMGIFKLNKPVRNKEKIIIEGEEYLIFLIEHNIDNDVTTVYADKM